MIDSILVTGSSGFIGFHTVKALLESGCEVVGIDDHNPSTSVLMKEKRLAILKEYSNFHFILGSILDKELLHKIFLQYSIKAVINLAARAGVRASILDPSSYLQVNEQGFLNILDCCQQYKVYNIVQASTSSIYEGASLPFVEDFSNHTCLSPYAASKKGAENYAYIYHYLYKFNISVIRFFTVYGPLGRSDMSVFKFIKGIYEQNPITIYGDGTQSRDFTYVQDIVEAILLCLYNNKGFNIWNAGNSNAYTLLDLIRLIEIKIGKLSIKEYKPFDPTDMKHTHANINKLKTHFNWQPQISLEEGIHLTTTWFLENYSLWVKDISLD